MMRAWRTRREVEGTGASRAILARWRRWACLAREASGTVSGSHWLHNLLAFPLFVCLVAAGFLLASALRRDRRWAELSRPVRAAALAAAAAFVWFGSAAFGANGGLVQRLLVLLAYGTPVAVAARITREA